MWLPIALADLAICILSPYLSKEDRQKLRRSDLLASWCLPMLSRSIAADEAEREALALFNSIKSLAEKQSK